MAVELMIDRG